MPTPFAAAVLSATVVLGCLPRISHAKLDPPAQCVVDKLGVAAKYLACRLKVQAHGVRTGRLPDFAQCDKRFGESIARIETKAGGACPVTGNALALKALMTAHTQSLVVGITTCGVELGGACWYLGTPGQSCNDVCDGAGRTYDTATGTFAGAEGSNENCAAVLAAFELGPLDEPDAPCAVGLGCAIGDDGFSFRCGLGTTSPSASVSITRRLCACL